MKKKITLSTDLLTALATADFTPTHYKMWLILAANEPMTQVQIAERLSIKKQNISKQAKDLLGLGLIVVDRIEGRNKFLTASTTPPKTPLPNKDQMSLFDNVDSK